MFPEPDLSSKMTFSNFEEEKFAINGVAVYAPMESTYGKSFLFGPDHDDLNVETLKLMDRYFLKNKKLKGYTHKSIFKDADLLTFYVRLKGEYKGKDPERNAEVTLYLHPGYYFDTVKKTFGLYFKLLEIE